MDWSAVFDEAQPAPGASDAEIEQFVATIGNPLSVTEVAEVNASQHNPFPENDPLHAAYRPFDPSRWGMPARPLPPDYLDFLRWSNGGWCRSGEREFGFFSTSDPTQGVRAMMLAYHLPEYMPGALAFAFDGGGTFYLFDTRQQAVAGNYPIVCSHSGNVGWEADAHWVVAESFEAACRGTVNVDDLRQPAEDADFDATELVAVYLEEPLKSVKTLLAIKAHLAIAASIAELKKLAQSVPCPIARHLSYMQAIHGCAKVNAIEPCLGIRSLRDPAVRLLLDRKK
jgi:hypothetical protein